MKDINKIKNYRTKYKRYYNIDFDNNFVIHHLDFDRNNNEISNLLLLPKELHQRYHFYLQHMDNMNWKSGTLKINTRIDKRRFDYFADETLIGFLETLRECGKWLAYKERLDFGKQHQEILQRWNNGNV